jgi:hypothetical protein
METLLRSLRLFGLAGFWWLAACSSSGGAIGHDAAAGVSGTAGVAADAGTTGIAGSVGAAGSGTAGDVATAGSVGTAGTGGAAGAGGARGAAGATVELPSSCSSAGWCAMPNTKLQSVCPAVSPGGATGCAAVVEAWSGGVADTNGGRLIVWGGGHNDYWGNEVYALDVYLHSLTRITQPSPTTNIASCPEALPDGTPSSRHTYNGLAFLGDVDRMFSFGGSKSSCGFLGAGTWTFDLAKLKWTSMDPHQGGTPAPNPGVVSDVDPPTHLVFLHDGDAFWQYEYLTNIYTKLKDGVHIDYHLTGVIDPKRKLFVMLGGKEAHVISTAADSTFAMTTPALTGCAALTDAAYPGLAYDSQHDRIVGWAGGDSVVVLDLDKLACTTVTYSGGPGDQRQAGTNGRWRYFPALSTFALVNAYDEDAYLFHLP